MENNDRTAMLRRLQICEFTLVELNLYLDTHPDDAEALKYYQKYRQMHKETKDEFTRKFGPVTAADVDCDTTWTWICDPWPWEYNQEG